MSVLTRFETREFPAARVIGKLVVHTILPGAQNPVPGLWDAMLRDGSLDSLRKMPELATPEPDSVGWMGEFDPATKRFCYIAGVLTKPGTAVPAGCAFRDLPACLMGVGWIRGRGEGGDLYDGAHDHTAKAMKEAGYEHDTAAGGYEMEYYSHREFGIPMAKGEQELVLGYFSPCRKIQAPLV